MTANTVLGAIITESLLLGSFGSGAAVLLHYTLARPAARDKFRPVGSAPERLARDAVKTILPV